MNSGTKESNMTTQYIVQDTNGTFYFKDKAMTIQHREDGPAINWVDGTKSWWLNGKRHREDGPAIEYSNGNKEWWLNDKRHREDGPAVEYSNGTKEWWLNDIRVSEEEHKTLTSKEHKIKIEGKEFTVTQLRELIDKAQKKSCSVHSRAL